MSINRVERTAAMRFSFDGDGLQTAVIAVVSTLPAAVAHPCRRRFARTMTYGSTVLATNFGRDPWQVRLWRAVLFFLPRANPNYEPMYQHVKKWYLELDDSRVPVREIGLDSSGQPLFGAPDERNFGFWTDSTEAFEPEHLSPLAAEEFERLWREVQRGRDAHA